MLLSFFTTTNLEETVMYLLRRKRWEIDERGWFYDLDHLIWGLQGRSILDKSILPEGFSIEIMSKDGKEASVMLTAKVIGTDEVVPIARLAEIEKVDNEENVLRRVIANLRSLADKLPVSLRQSADNLARYAPIARNPIKNES